MIQNTQADNRRALWWAATAALFYTASNLTMQVGAVHMNRLVATILMGTPTWITTLVVFLATDRHKALGRVGKPGGPSWGTLFSALGLGIAYYVLGNPLFIMATQYGGVILSVPTVQTQALWGALLAAVMLAQPLTAGLLAGVGVFLGGLVLLSWGQSTGAAFGPMWAWAIPLGLATGLFWGIGNTLTSKSVKGGIDPFGTLALGTTVGFSSLHLYLLASGQASVWSHTSPHAYLLMGIAGLFNCGAQIAITTAYGLGEVAKVSTVNSTYIGLVAILAWAFLHNPLNLVMVAGLVLIAAGTWMVQTQGRTQHRAPPASTGDGAAAWREAHT